MIEGEKISAGDKPSKQSGEVAYNSFKEAADQVANGQCSALVTLPLAKEFVEKSVLNFHGHTDELQKWWGGESLMTLTGGELRVSLVTDHEALKDVPKLITLDRVLAKARMLRQEIKRFFTGGREPKLHLLGLNPHAGENGILGREEKDILFEALDILRKEGGQWSGPWSADAFFAMGNYGDAVLAMYHDQGLIPVKMLGKSEGVHMTLGLPFIRTSPNHGTAFDIAGKNQADPRSFQQACRLATEMFISQEKL